MITDTLQHCYEDTSMTDYTNEFHAKAVQNILRIDEKDRFRK